MRLSDTIAIIWAAACMRARAHAYVITKISAKVHIAAGMIPLHSWLDWQDVAAPDPCTKCLPRSRKMEAGGQWATWHARRARVD